MTEKVINTIYDYDMLNPGNKVVCALSGGSDSCCLLDVLIRISGKLGITVAAAHLNHMLRGDESERDEAFVRKLCESKGIELYTEKIDINSVSAKTKKSIELSAREERYEFFRRAKKTLGADITATAHNADDNLETVLFNLVRGTGLKGLCGIPPKRGDIIRPLIRITADEIDEYIRDNGIGFIEDSSNMDLSFARNRIRNLVIPVLKTINPGAVSNTLRMTGVLRDEEEYLEDLADMHLSECEISDACAAVPISVLKKLHPAIKRRLILRLSEKAGGVLDSKHVDDITELCNNKSPSARLCLPDMFSVRRDYDKIVFEHCIPEKSEDIIETELREGDTVTFGGFAVTCEKARKYEEINNSLNTFFIACDRIDEKIIVRSRRAGDSVKLRGRPEKLLKKLFIEKKVSKNIRGGIPVLADKSCVAAVYGFGVDMRKAARPGETAYRIVIKERN